MISFDDLKLTDTETLFFIPEVIKSAVLHEFKKSGIPYQNISAFDLDYQKYKTILENTAARFTQAGCQTSSHTVGAILSKASPEDLFQKCLLFFGETIDPDYKKMLDEWQRKSDESYERDYKNWLREGEIPVHTKN